MLRNTLKFWLHLIVLTEGAFIEKIAVGITGNYAELLGLIESII
jgi:hypothetical protein